MYKSTLVTRSSGCPLRAVEYNPSGIEKRYVSSRDGTLSSSDPMTYYRMNAMIAASKAASGAAIG